MLMQPMDLFLRALKGWDIEVVDVQEEDKVLRKRLHHVPSGTMLKVAWSPEVAADLKAFHGEGAEVDLVLMLLNEVAQALIAVKAKAA